MSLRATAVESRGRLDLSHQSQTRTSSCLTKHCSMEQYFGTENTSPVPSHILYQPDRKQKRRGILERRILVIVCCLQMMNTGVLLIYMKTRMSWFCDWQQTTKNIRKCTGHSANQNQYNFFAPYYNDNSTGSLFDLGQGYTNDTVDLGNANLCVIILDLTVIENPSFMWNGNCLNITFSYGKNTMYIMATSKLPSEWLCRTLAVSFLSCSGSSMRIGAGATQYPWKNSEKQETTMKSILAFLTKRTTRNMMLIRHTRMPCENQSYELVIIFWLSVR